jgi:hypothetical protein
MLTTRSGICSGADIAAVEAMGFSERGRSGGMGLSNSANLNLDDVFSIIDWVGDTR